MNLLLLCALSAWAGDPAPVAPAPAMAVAGPDRSRPPEVLPPVPLDQPEPEVFSLRPGVDVWLVTVPGSRKVSASVWLHRGSLDLDGRRSFASAATGWLQDVATRSYSSDELEITEDMTDTSVSSSSPGLRRTDVSLETPRENLADGMALLAEVLRSPKFPGKDVAQFKALRRHWYTTEAPSDPQTVAGMLLDQGWYPADSAYGGRPDLAELDGIVRGDLVSRHARLLSEAPVSVLVVGDVTRADLEPLLVKTLEGMGVAGEENPLPPFEAAPGTRVLASDMPGQAQAVVMLRKSAPGLDHADRVAFEVLDWAIGGHFMSRLNANLREEKGFTYGASSWYVGKRTHGLWSAGTTVKVENVGATIAEIGAEIDEVVADGVTDVEIDSAWKEWVTGWNTTRQTAATAFGLYATLFDEGRTVADARADLDAVGALDAAGSREVAGRWFGEGSPALWVVVGDRAAIEPQLQALGLEVQWVTPEQAILGTF